jgi:hypothetical protein
MQLYFQHELYPIKMKVSKERVVYQEKSLKAFIELMKDFEVYPKLISARDLFYIFFESLELRPREILGIFSDEMG